MSKPGPDAIDVFVGSRVKMRRVMLGMSQTVLGDRLGVTFQQIQKYENGKNRISASKLQLMGDVLGVPPSYFFQDGGELAGSIGDTGLQHEANMLQSYLSTREGLKLNTAFIAIKDPKVRRGVIALAKSLVQMDDDARTTDHHDDAAVRPDA